MRVGALYDIHGNVPALEAVLAEVDADLILVGGDVVGGPDDAGAVERLQGVLFCHATARNDHELVTYDPAALGDYELPEATRAEAIEHPEGLVGD